MIAGGNMTLLLDACFHLLGDEIESIAIVQNARPKPTILRKSS